MKFIQPNTDLRVTLTGAQDKSDDTYLNSATVSAVVQDSDGSEVVSSQSLSYVTSSNGNYQATIDKALFSSLVRGRIYVVLITATDSGTGLDRQWKIIATYDYVTGL